MRSYLIIFCLLFFGCGGLQNLPKDRAVTTPVKVPYSVADIKITDLRSNVTPADWKLPLLGTRKEEQIINPAIDGELRQGILGMIKDSETPGAPRANVTLYIDEAYYKVAGDWKSVSEFTSFRCRMDFSEADGGNVNTAQTELSYEYNSVKASEKHVKRLFELTVRNGVYDALSEISGRNE